MLKIGDKVIYGASGVMTIADIREESIGDVSRSYYVLRSVTTHSESLTFVPADNDALVSSIRPLLTKDETINLIRTCRDIPPIEWLAENRARQEYFKKIMESADRAKMISMIRAIENNARRREAEGKKNFISDENAKARAQKFLATEFSVVLGIPESELKEFIAQNIN